MDALLCYAFPSFFAMVKTFLLPTACHTSMFFSGWMTSTRKIPLTSRAPAGSALILVGIALGIYIAYWCVKNRTPDDEVSLDSWTRFRIAVPLVVPFLFLSFFAGFAYNNNEIAFIVLISLSSALHLSITALMIRLTIWLRGWDQYVEHEKALVEGLPGIPPRPVLGNAFAFNDPANYNPPPPPRKPRKNRAHPPITEPYNYADRAHVSPDITDYGNYPKVYRQMAERFKPSRPAPLPPHLAQAQANLAGPADYAQPIYVPSLDRYMQYI